MKYYKTFSIVLLLILLGCNPESNTTSHKSQNIAKTALSSQIVGDTSIQAQEDKKAIITIDNTSIPNNLADKIKNSSSQSYDLYYIPIPSIGLKENIEAIRQSLHLSEWITKLPNEISPLGVNTSSHPHQITLSRLLLSKLNPITLNLHDKNNPRISIRTKNDRIYSDRKLIRTNKDSTVQKTFDKWLFNDSDITKMNNIPKITPLNYGGIIHVLFLQVIMIKTASSAYNSTNSNTEYYLNPINIDSLDSIQYTVE